MPSRTTFVVSSNLTSFSWPFPHSSFSSSSFIPYFLSSQSLATPLPFSRSLSRSLSRISPAATMTPNQTSTHLANGATKCSYRGEILCNRALNMAKIRAVGFDMDYTLAMYHSEQFETLAATGALNKLVNVLGYPKPLLDIKYDHSFFIRGLVVDKERGNIIKLDRHKYVKRALHGFKPLSKEDRTEIYDKLTISGGGFGEPRFAVLDAMFALPDAFLFSSVVKYKDEHPTEIPQTYKQVYDDVRKSVDMCHRDGSIKDRVAEDPARYIERDPHLVSMLRRIKRSGRKVFLLTNSLWNYTHTVMKYLYAGEQAGHWIDLFDVIITGSTKPSFLVNPKLPLYRCHPDTGLLENTEGVYDESPTEYLSKGKCFQGGNYKHLHDLLGVTNGTQLLYVGDHMFSDVLRSKRTLGWRTMLIVPELEHEINMLYNDETMQLAVEIQRRRDYRDVLDERVDGLELKLVNGNDDPQSLQRAKKALQAAKKELKEERAKIIELVDNYHSRFHPVWGQLFKTGMQNSRFAEQVEDYACLYTSRVTNVGLVSPEMYWRAMSDLMPHDRLRSAPMYRLLSQRTGSLVGEG